MSKAEEIICGRCPQKQYCDYIKTGRVSKCTYAGYFSEGYEQAAKDIKDEIEHRTLNAHDLSDDAKKKEFYCGMDEAFTDILVYIDSLEES